MVIRSTCPSLVFLMENRLFGFAADTVKHKVGFANSLHVDCVGKSGGLLLLWDDELDIDLQSYFRRHIDVFITPAIGTRQRFTGFYGNPDQSQRSHSLDD